MMNYKAQLISLGIDLNGCRISKEAFDALLNIDIPIPVTSHFNSDDVGIAHSFKSEDDYIVSCTVTIDGMDLKGVPYKLAPMFSVKPKDIINEKDGITLIQKAKLIEVSLVMEHSDPNIGEIVSLDGDANG